MIRHAVAGHVPLIRCTTTDVIHVEYLLQEMFSDITIGKAGTKKDCDLYYQVGLGTYTDLTSAYLDAEENEYTLVFINVDPQPELMDCGELIPSKELVKIFLNDNLPDGMAEAATRYLYGLTYQTLKQVLSLCPVYYSAITVDNLRAIKNKLMGQQVGIVPVNVETDFFFGLNKPIHDWINTNKKYMFADVDARLIPKGMLLYGEAGTGKTEVARYIARGWDIPLFLLDINSMLTKWQGEAESHLNKALDTFDAESPCIVLFDEVEKLFNNTSENDTSQRLLSRILWWLQLRESKVFVIMTCNDMEIIPPELYRAGRISTVFEMLGVPVSSVSEFTTQLLNSFGVTKKIEINRAIKVIKKDVEAYTPHAKLNQMVIDYLQQHNYGI